jgi:predicted nuclease with TOPRIM domain
VFDSLINYMDKFGQELLVIQFGFLVILSTLFLWLWFSNRRKYHNLKHAIPANVVKDYLDSIIQNSTALKSSLFRGGGLEVNGVPSVMPLHNLMGGEGLAVNGAPSTALLEEVNQKKAAIAALEAQLSSLQGARKEIEGKLSSSQNQLSSAENKIKELEALLGQARNSGGAAPSDGTLQAELNMVTKERDELRDRLREFEIISDDLANLKRLQQENEQLKKSLAAQGGALPSAPEPAQPKVDPENILSQADVSDLFQDMGQAAAPEQETTEALENFLSEEAPSEAEPSHEASVEAAPQTEEDKPAEGKQKSEKTPEDLLSEFEKMLG